MATPEQIDRQIALETTQVQDGIAKLRADTAKAQQRQYASSTVYAQKLLKQAIPGVAKEVDRIRTTRLARGKAGKALAPMVQHTMTIDPETIALITLKVLFDVCTDPTDKADLVNNVIDRVGIAIEQEAKWRYFNSVDPELLAFIKKKHHKGKGLHYRDYDMTRRFKDHGLSLIHI